MKPVLLIIGEITPRMAERFSTAFTCHYIDKIANTEQFLAANGPSIQAIATSGHDGVPDNLLDNLSNLKIISNYGLV